MAADLSSAASTQQREVSRRALQVARCALCSIDFAGRHLCPACLESGKTKGKMADLENRRVLYDNIALAVSLLPLHCRHAPDRSAPPASTRARSVRSVR